MSFCKVIAMGRLTRDPELRTTQSGLSVTNFTIAVDKPYNKDNQHPEADFHDCVAWRSTADFITKHFSKGDKIAVEGMLQNKTFTDKEGNKRKGEEIVVDKAYFVEKKKSTDETTSNESNYVAPVATEEFDNDTETDSEDLPF